MKNLFLLSLISLFFIGCSEKVIMVPQKTSYPIFNASEFKKAQDYELEAEIRDINGSTYIQIEKDKFMDFVRYTKKIKKNYNILLSNLNKYNTEIEKINTEIQNQEPKEIK